MHARVLLLAAVLLAGCASAPEPSAGEDGGWALTDIDGATHAQRAPDASATVLFFMATWCGSCRQKAPVLAEAHETHAASGVRFLSVDFDPSESREEIEAWIERYAQTWPHGVDDGLRLQRHYGVTTQSSVVVTDAEGRAVERFGYGAVTREALDSAIARALAARAPPSADA